MRNEKQLQKIAKVVTETLAADFDNNVRIIDVRVLDDVDFDGDDVLRIEVVFSGSHKDVDAKKISGAVRHVRPKLTDLGERAFPLFSFISQREANAGRPAPA